MNNYRAGNLLNVQRVKVSINQPAVVKSRHTTLVPPPRHGRAPVQPPQPQAPQTPSRTQSPPPKPIPRNRPVIVTQHEQRSNRPKPVGFVSRGQQKIVSNNRAVSLTENRRSRSQTEHLEQHRQAIMRLKDIGVGKVLIILANGPSINDIPIEDLDRKDKIDLMCINKPNQKVWPTKFWSFCDQSQFTRNQGAWDSYSGTLINATAVRARHRHQVLVKNISGTGFSKDLIKGYYIGRSTTYASMQLGLWMNYDKVFIFGCDMAAVNGKLHFYGQNPDVNNDNRIERFKQEAESFMHAAQTLSSEDRQKFVFCSNYNKFKFIDYFQRMDHTVAVQLILDSMGYKQASK